MGESSASSSSSEADLLRSLVSGLPNLIEQLDSPAGANDKGAALAFARRYKEFCTSPGPGRSYMPGVIELHSEIEKLT
jgi:hypothetical protein